MNGYVDTSSLTVFSIHKFAKDAEYISSNYQTSSGARVDNDSVMMSPNAAD